MEKLKILNKFSPDGPIPLEIFCPETRLVKQGLQNRFNLFHMTNCSINRSCYDYWERKRGSKILFSLYNTHSSCRQRTEPSLCGDWGKAVDYLFFYCSNIHPLFVSFIILGCHDTISRCNIIWKCWHGRTDHRGWFTLRYCIIDSGICHYIN